MCKKETPLTQQPLLLLQRVVSRSGALTLLRSHKHSHTHTSKRSQVAVESTTRSLVCSRCWCCCVVDADVVKHTHTHTLRSLSKSKFQVRLLQFIREFAARFLHFFFSPHNRLEYVRLALFITALEKRAPPPHLPFSVTTPAHQSVNFCFYVSCGPFCAGKRRIKTN